MRILPLAAPLCLFALGCGAAAPTPATTATATRSGTMVFLSNDSIKLGVDTAKGGAITYLARVTDGRNVINDHDLGRTIAQSYYSGPQPYGHPKGAWAAFGWNPVSAGDVAGNRSHVEAVSTDKATLYIRSVPLQWALEHVPCECRFEQWITLSSNVVHVRQRLTNRRMDTAQYQGFPQEVPAVYVNGFLRRIATYTGDRPFTGDAIARPPARWQPAHFQATENWVALVDDTDWGLGVINDATSDFDAGFSGPQRDGDEHDDQTGYISPRMIDILDHDIVYDTAYTLVLGSVDEIRRQAMALKPADPRPAFTFAHDREGWSYQNARDAGWPIAGGLRVTVTHDDPQLTGPKRPFAAAAVPALYVTAAFAGGSGPAQLFWSTSAAPGFSPTRVVTVPVQSDGATHVVRIPTADAPGWSGLITGLRFDPPGTTGARATICAISWQPMPC